MSRSVRENPLQALLNQSQSTHSVAVDVSVRKLLYHWDTLLIQTPDKDNYTQVVVSRLIEACKRKGLETQKIEAFIKASILSSKHDDDHWLKLGYYPDSDKPDKAYDSRFKLREIFNLVCGALLHYGGLVNDRAEFPDHIISLHHSLEKIANFQNLCAAGIRNDLVFLTAPLVSFPIIQDLACCISEKIEKYIRGYFSRQNAAWEVYRNWLISWIIGEAQPGRAKEAIQALLGVDEVRLEACDQSVNDFAQSVRPELRAFLYQCMNELQLGLPEKKIIDQNLEALADFPPPTVHYHPYEIKEIIFHLGQGWQNHTAEIQEKFSRIIHQFIFSTPVTFNKLQYQCFTRVYTLYKEVLMYQQRYFVDKDELKAQGKIALEIMLDKLGRFNEAEINQVVSKIQVAIASWKAQQELEMGSFIENFFAYLDGCDVELRAGYVRQLTDSNLKLTLSDEKIQRFITENQAHQGEIDLTPYDVNLVLLHAALHPVNEWSPLFTEVLKQVIEWIQSWTDEEVVAKSLKKHTYPQKLLVIFENLIRIKQGALEPIELVFNAVVVLSYGSQYTDLFVSHESILLDMMHSTNYELKELLETSFVVHAQSENVFSLFSRIISERLLQRCLRQLNAKESLEKVIASIDKQIWKMADEQDNTKVNLADLLRSSIFLKALCQVGESTLIAFLKSPPPAAWSIFSTKEEGGTALYQFCGYYLRGVPCTDTVLKGLMELLLSMPADAYTRKTEKGGSAVSEIFKPYNFKIVSELLKSFPEDFMRLIAWFLLDIWPSRSEGKQSTNESLLFIFLTEILRHVPANQLDILMDIFLKIPVTTWTVNLYYKNESEANALYYLFATCNAHNVALLMKRAPCEFALFLSRLPVSAWSAFRAYEIDSKLSVLALFFLSSFEQMPAEIAPRFLDTLINIPASAWNHVCTCGDFKGASALTFFFESENYSVIKEMIRYPEKFIVLLNRLPLNAWSASQSNDNNSFFKFIAYHLRSWPIHETARLIPLLCRIPEEIWVSSIDRGGCAGMNALWALFIRKFHVIKLFQECPVQFLSLLRAFPPEAWSAYPSLKKYKGVTPLALVFDRSFPCLSSQHAHMFLQVINKVPDRVWVEKIEDQDSTKNSIDLFLSAKMSPMVVQLACRYPSEFLACLKRLSVLYADTMPASKDTGVFGLIIVAVHQQFQLVKPHDQVKIIKFLLLIYPFFAEVKGGSARQKLERILMFYCRINFLESDDFFELVKCLFDVRLPQDELKDDEFKTDSLYAYLFHPISSKESIFSKLSEKILEMEPSQLLEMVCSMSIKDLFIQPENMVSPLDVLIVRLFADKQKHNLTPLAKYFMGLDLNSAPDYIQKFMTQLPDADWSVLNHRIISAGFLSGFAWQLSKRLSSSQIRAMQANDTVPDRFKQLLNKKYKKMIAANSSQEVTATASAKRSPQFFDTTRDADDAPPSSKPKLA